MAVRFRRSGEPVEIKDHNQLLNRGTRTHAEIDTYLSEIDTARNNNQSLDSRFNNIESKNTLQDNEIDAAIAVNEEQDERLDDIDLKNEEYDSQLTAIADDLDDLDERLSALESNGSPGSVDVQEVINARTDKNGITYSTLKERLDAQQGVSSGGGESGSSVVSSGYIFQVEQNDIENRRTFVIEKPFAVGKNEIEVFRGGVRQIKDVHYTEVSELIISFQEPLVPSEVVIIRRRDREGTQSPLQLSSEFAIAADSSRTFHITELFNSPYKTLEVFYNGTLLAPEKEYVTGLNNTVTLSFDPVIGSLFLFQVVDKKKFPESFLLEEHQVISPENDTYRLNTFTFLKNELEVYVQGVRWYAETDYTEVDDKTVTFIRHLPPNGQISFVKENGFKIVDQKDLKILEQRMDDLEEKTSSESDIKQYNVSIAEATTVNPAMQVLNITYNPDFKFNPVTVLRFTGDTWKAAVHGFDYDYDYPREDKLRVYLYKDGNYKINYYAYTYY